MPAPCFDTTCTNPAHLCLSCGDHGHYRETCEKFPPKCLHCELPGHVIDDCPRAETILCFNCQKCGHTQSKCPKLQKKRKSDTIVEFVSADMLAEANKRTKIAHNSWLAKYGELETKFGISEGIIKELRSENEDLRSEIKDLKSENEDLKSEKENLQGRNGRLMKDIDVDEAWNETQATKIDDLEGDKAGLWLKAEDQRRENESLKKQMRALKSSVRKSLWETASLLDA